MIYLLNFKKQFAQAVADGSKRQTIRQHRKDGKRMQAGETLKLYTGLRTRGARLLREARVTRCRSIRIDITDRELIVDGDKLNFGETILFAQADGFATLDEFFAFFRDQYGVAVFEGFCVEWAA